jgi:septal ring factor EnvC (AmiA/AmiB activator)
LSFQNLDTASRDHQNVEELKQARRDYEEKIRRLEIENNELSTLRAQYAVCLKDGEYYKKELAKHTNELKDLRKMKVQLTRELRQEFIRHKQAEQAKAREIATLKRVDFIDNIKLEIYFSDFFLDTNAKR